MVCQDMWIAAVVEIEIFEKFCIERSEECGIPVAAKVSDLTQDYLDLTGISVFDFRLRRQDSNPLADWAGNAPRRQAARLATRWQRSQSKGLDCESA